MPAPDPPPSPAPRAPDPPQLRDARDTDLPFLLALEAQFPGDRIRAPLFRHHLHNPRAYLRVVVAGGHVAGYHLTLVPRLSRWARLYSIVVGQGVRGGGHGRRLLVDAETCARAAGRRGLRLEVRQDNAAAIALYEAAGYRRVKPLRRYYDDGRDAWRYRREFAPPERNTCPREDAP